jgi:hypothetical protein
MTTLAVRIRAGVRDDGEDDAGAISREEVEIPPTVAEAIAAHATISMDTAADQPALVNRLHIWACRYLENNLGDVVPWLTLEQ